MKPTIIISVRGCHMDDLPANLLQKSIKFIKETYPTLPMTLCFEGVPNQSLLGLRSAVKEKIDNGRSRYSGREYTDEEAEFDQSLYWLLGAANVFNTGFVLTDLAGMDRIPLGSPAAEAKRNERESCMARHLLQVAAQTGGIIFDFGGDNHIPGMQKHLIEDPNFVAARDLKAHFFCVYSNSAQKYFPAEHRMLQFIGIPREQYPLGLAFKTTALSEEPQQQTGSILEDLNAEITRRGVLFAKFQQEVLIPAATELLSKLSLTTLPSLPDSVNPPFIPQASGALAGSSSSPSSSSANNDAPPLTRKETP